MADLLNVFMFLFFTTFSIVFFSCEILCSIPSIRWLTASNIFLVLYSVKNLIAVDAVFKQLFQFEFQLPSQAFQFHASLFSLSLL